MYPLLLPTKTGEDEKGKGIDAAFLRIERSLASFAGAAAREDECYMFVLVDACERYPEFLPWCDRAKVIEHDAAGMTAEVGLAFSGFHHSFTTRNTHVPGREVHLKLVDGPFSNLDGVWKFTPVGEEGERACRVELNLSGAFNTLRATVAALRRRPVEFFRVDAKTR